MKRPKVQWPVPPTYKSEAFEKLLNEAYNNFPILLPYLVFSGFCGLRTAELLRERKRDEVLQWEDINWSLKRIKVRPEVANSTSRKTGDLRYVEIVEAVEHWIAPVRKDAGPVLELSQSAFRREMAKLFIAAKVKSVDNGFRHSYASYWLAAKRKDGLVHHFRD
jgi:integrase